MNGGAGDPPSPHDGSVVEIAQTLEAGVGLSTSTQVARLHAQVSGHDDVGNESDDDGPVLEVQGDESTETTAEERSNDNGLVQAVEASERNAESESDDDGPILEVQDEGVNVERQGGVEESDDDDGLVLEVQ